MAAAGCAQRTSITKAAPVRSARPPPSTVGAGSGPASTVTPELHNRCANHWNPRGAHRLADPSPIATPAPRFSSTGVYPVRSRPRVEHQQRYTSGTDGVDHLTP